jgi:hypothetical protein
LNPQKTQINLKGAVTDIFTTSPDHPLSWTGIKWDLYATSTKDGRTLYIELYFVRTGGNLLWELMQPYGFSIHPGHNEVLKVYSTSDNALLAITEPSMSFNQAFVSIVTLGPTTWFSIDVTGIFGFVAYEYATFFPEVWDYSRSINDYNLTQVSLCLEANNNGASVTPQCSISLEDFELKGSYLADINLDGKIDNTDVSTVNNALNSALGDSSYLPNADLNLDRIIDSTDLAMMTNYVGKTFPAPWLTISNSAGGTTNPPPGTYLYDCGSSVTVTAYAYAYHTFDGWILDGSIIVYDNITVTMDSDHTLDAYFSVSGGGDGGGGEPCPTLFVWNGSAYVDYGVIDIHNPSGEDVVREVPVQSEDVSISNYKAKFRLREGWEGLNFSESVIDQVKLYAVGKNGNRYLCPLIKATHSTLGKVLPQLLLSDDYRVQILLLETIDLEFAVPYKNVQGYTFTIEGCNKWKM